MFEKVKSFNDSVQKFISNDLPEVTDSEFFDRMNICKDCEFYNKLQSKCIKCGCFLFVKARWATEKCPIDKWGSETKSDKGSFSISIDPNTKDCNCGNKNV